MRAWLEPPRLDGPKAGAAPGLGRAIRAARAMQGSVDEVQALAVRLEGALASGLPPSPRASGMGAGPGTHLARGGLVLVALVGLALLPRLFSTLAAPMHLLPNRAARQSTAARPMLPLPGWPPSTADDAARAPGPAPASTPGTTSARTPRFTSPSSPPLRPEAELSLIGQAQRALLGQPENTLELLAEHARDYPHGVFIEEREVLWMEAQLKLGHRERVYSRAQRFLETFPRSTHARRVRELLEARTGAAASSTESTR